MPWTGVNIVFNISFCSWTVVLRIDRTRLTHTTFTDECGCRTPNGIQIYIGLVISKSIGNGTCDCM